MSVIKLSLNQLFGAHKSVPITNDAVGVTQSGRKVSRLGDSKPLLLKVSPVVSKCPAKTLAERDVSIVIVEEKTLRTAHNESSNAGPIQSHAPVEPEEASDKGVLFQDFRQKMRETVEMSKTTKDWKKLDKQVNPRHRKPMSRKAFDRLMVRLNKQQIPTF